ncbi:hypothetical protein [Pseudoalteromonas rubra]|uniref:hypothetical protein n=1 Tax=Pseudoalteromonas rubra TaxID=43658 RepID=UPI000F7A6547|nr:hypothetical protein [Pseudoalteromonas rubra]
MELSKPISLDFTKENFISLLNYGADENQLTYSHKQIAEWSEKFWNKYHDIDAPKEIEDIMSTLADVETQWDLYLVSTYKVEQLQNINLDSVNLPFSWFKSWLDEIDT